MLTPRPEQLLAAQRATQALRDSTPILFTSPTGTGKSIIELLTQDAYPGAWIVEPTLDILADLLRKREVEPPESESALRALASTHYLATPGALRNALLRGEGPSNITALIIGECHHDTAETWQQLHALTGCPRVGFTATPFRGSPRGTAELRKQWPEIVPVMTYAEAACLRRLSHPVCSITPLVDDDVLEVSNGEFVVSSVERHTTGKLGDVVEMCRKWWDGASWDRPTMFALPSRDLARTLQERLSAAGVSAVALTGEDGPTARQEAFRGVVARAAAIVQVRVVSEGVDLPLRRQIDLAPCLSPMLWMQRFGRITRPVGDGEALPEYVCCNRNLLRHAYLLEGLIPPSVIADGQRIFGGPGTRAAARAVGLESLGRLKPIDLPLAGGLTGTCYCVSAGDGAGKVEQYAVILHPTRPEPLWARRVNVAQSDGSRAYGKWSRCEAPADLTGFASVPPGPLSDKQSAWWKRSAARFGLDPAATVTRKNFVALPVLSDLRARL